MSSRETSESELGVLDEGSGELRPSWATRLRRVPISLALSWFVVAVVLIWAAIKSLGLSADNPKLYRAGTGPDRDRFFRDVTVGTNGPCGQNCTAGPGYDNVTGLGTPLAVTY